MLYNDPLEKGMCSMDSINVTFVLGFLEAGKTTYINQLLSTIDLQEKVLVIQCEEGEWEIGDYPNVVVETMEHSGDFIKPFLNDFAAKHQPNQIIIEVNGFWQLFSQ